MITSKKELRRQFWATFPKLSRRRIKDYSGNGKMYPTDVRCAFSDWKDSLSKSGEIAPELAETTLSP